MVSWLTTLRRTNRSHISKLNTDAWTHTEQFGTDYQFLIGWVPKEKSGTFQLCNVRLQSQIYAALGNTYHWIQLAKWMEYWQKFSFITSFSKGLIGYSLRYSEEREAAVCMSRIVDWVEGVQGCVQGEELRTRQTGKYITEAEGEDFTYCGTLKAWLATRWED